MGVHPEHPMSILHDVNAYLRFRDAAAPGLPVYLTEWGWDSAGGGEDCTAPADRAGDTPDPLCVSEAAQALYAVRGALLLARKGLSRLTWFFYGNTVRSSSLWDQAKAKFSRSGLSSSSEAGFQNKQSLYALELFVSSLGATHFLSVLVEDASAYVYVLGDPVSGATHVVAWRPVDGDDNTTTGVRFAAEGFEAKQAYFVGLPQFTSAALPRVESGDWVMNISAVPTVVELRSPRRTRVVDISDLRLARGFAIQHGDARNGAAVAIVGDLNGDGFSDVLVGSGACGSPSFVVHGRARGHSLNISRLATPRGFAITPYQACQDAPEGWGHASAHVSRLADVNGDGFDDFAVGQPAGGRKVEEGEVFVILGRSLPITDIVLGHSGSAGFKIVGASVGDLTGFSVAGGGDVNGDGRPDIVVGAPGAVVSGALSAGLAYVVYGRDLPDKATRHVKLAHLDAKTGFRVLGSAAGQRCGVSLASCGDVNGDGLTDFVVACAGAGASGHGNASAAVYVVFGSADRTRKDVALADLASADGFRISTSGVLSSRTLSVTCADINGDGFSDVVVGGMLGGIAHVVFGIVTPIDVDLRNLQAPQGMVLVGGTLDMDMPVSTAGDFNGDGVDDIIIGAPETGPRVRAVAFILFGRRGMQQVSNLNLHRLGAHEGLELRVGRRKALLLGFSVGGAGDVNGDGLDDIVVGAPVKPGGRRTGNSYVLYGSHKY